MLKINMVLLAIYMGNNIMLFTGTRFADMSFIVYFLHTFAVYCI